MFPNQNAFGNKKKRYRKPNPSTLKRKANRLMNFASHSQYQAPHHDEPEDLTDDLAPTTSAPNPNTQTQQTQPQSAGADNKLNFKFQKTIQKTPDWSKYQNNFKTLSGASPDRETDEVQVTEEQKSESRWDQKTVDLTTESSSNPNEMLATLPPSVLQVVQEKLKEMPDKKPFIMPKMKDDPPVKAVPVVTTVPMVTTIPVVTRAPTVTKSTTKLTKQSQKNTVKVEPAQTGLGKIKPIDVRFLQNKPFKSDPNMYSFPQQMSAHPFATPYDYPKGIPKSFLTQDKKTLNEMTVVPSNTSLSPKPVPEYQEQTSVDLPSWMLPTQPPLAQTFGQHPVYQPMGQDQGANAPMFVQHPQMPDRPYSPSDAYSEAAKVEEDVRDGSESPDVLQSGQKRLSAFKRLGPLTKPKKPKLTINLMFNKEEAVREVVGETEEESQRLVPVHLRRDIISSSDETVKKYLPYWPWKRNITTRKTVSARASKSVMILEQEQMEAGYDKDSMFVMVTVKGYPVTWKKENVLDAILECVKGKSFIPCFIEFTPQECKFLVIRCRAALLAIHKVGFCIRKDDVELTVTIALTDTGLNQIDMIPRLVLRKRLMTNYDGEKTLDLREFFTAPDVSHFVYFPLNRVTNQVELIQLQSAVAWEHLTELNLSNNRITSLDGFDLQSTTPKLRSLDLSHNLLDKVTILLKCRYLPLRSIKLEGNPLCHDYIDSGHYVKVVKMIFSGLNEIDGIPLTFKGDLPPMKINYCPEAALNLIEKFLETFFPLLEAPQDDRTAIEHMYDKDAVLTVTFRNKLRYGSAYRYFRNLFLFARNLEEGDCESVRGAHTIGSLVNKWPAVEHDRYTTTVDVLQHDDSTTIFRIGGILKLTAETLAEDEHFLTFTRSIVLHTKNGVEYKIHNEMLYWDVPCEESMQTAFNRTTVRPKQLSLRLETPPDEDLKSKLLSIFIKLAGIDKKRGEKCLEKKNWDLRGALDLYIKLLKLDDLSSLSGPRDAMTTPQPQPS